VFLLRLPTGERDHVVRHLPTDVRRVLRTLAELVPEEVADISAVLPAGLRQLWSVSTTATDDEGGRHG
jgi:uncharacterized protein (DUF2267 family)